MCCYGARDYNRAGMHSFPSVRWVRPNTEVLVWLLLSAILFVAAVAALAWGAVTSSAFREPSARSRGVGSAVGGSGSCVPGCCGVPRLSSCCLVLEPGRGGRGRSVRPRPVGAALVWAVRAVRRRPVGVDGRHARIPPLGSRGGTPAVGVQFTRVSSGRGGHVGSLGPSSQRPEMLAHLRVHNRLAYWAMRPYLLIGWAGG